MIDTLKEDYYSLESERLYYRKITRDHIKPWMAFFVGNDRLDFVGLKNDLPIEELSGNWIEKQMKRYADGQLGTVAAFSKETHELIGLCGLINRLLKGKNELEVAYSLIPTAWGKGYGTEMAKRMKKFGEDNQLAPRFISMIHPENEASMNVARKNGMKPLFNSKWEGWDVVVFGTTNPAYSGV